MRRLRVLVFLLALAGAVQARAALPLPGAWKVPPLDGELQGELNAVLLGGAPKLKWKLSVRTETPRERVVQYAIDGYGCKLRGTARLDPMGEGTWRIEEMEVNLGEWFGWLAPHLSAELAPFAVAGTLRAEGEGTWRGGKLGGRAKVALQNGRIENAARKVVLEGVGFDVTIEDLAEMRTAPAQAFTWTSGQYDVVKLGAGRIVFAVNGEQVKVEFATIAVFGGELAVRDVAFSTKKPEFTASAQMTGVDVGQLLFLFPEILANASGRLDGFIDLARDARGFAMGAGYLGLRSGETAQLRFRPTPGIISAALPTAINKLYPGIAHVETGGIPLKAELLQMEFMPKPDEQGRTAWIHIVGQPTDPGFKGPIDMTVNIRGPLDQVINFGANSALRLMGR